MPTKAVSKVKGTETMCCSGKNPPLKQMKHRTPSYFFYLLTKDEGIMSSPGISNELEEPISTEPVSQ